MKLKYREYLENKEMAIGDALQDYGTEGIRLYLTQKSARKNKDVHNCSTLHEYLLRKTNDREGVIVVDEAAMYPDPVLLCFLQSVEDSRSVLFIQDKNQIAPNGTIISRLKERGKVVELNLEGGKLKW